MIHTRPVEMRDALRSVAAKRAMPLAFSSREIQEQLPADIARVSFFSARTTLKGYLSESQALIGRLVQPDVITQPDGTLRRVGRGESINPAQVRTAMQRHLRDLGYTAAEGEEGTLKDLASDRRVNLIINTQTQMARGFARERAVQSDAIRTAFPADRMYRALPRDEKRNWQSRWNQARARLGSATQATAATSQAGPFVAPKNDPIWPAISRFGNSYPPFDFNSGMRKRSVPASQARQHGITRTPDPAPDPFEPPLESPVSESTSPRMIDAIKRVFSNAAFDTARRVISLQGGA